MNAEQQRRLHNIATIGTVTEINLDEQTMRLAVGDNETDFLPMPALAAGQVRVWRCPSVGEQFLLVSPSGDLANAIPVLSLYSEKNPAPSTDKDEIRIRYNDDDYLSVHVSNSQLHLKINNIVLDAPLVTTTGDLQVDGGIHANELIKSDTEVQAQDIKLTSHGHKNVASGSAISGEPV